MLPHAGACNFCIWLYNMSDAISFTCLNGMRRQQIEAPLMVYDSVISSTQQDEAVHKQGRTSLAEPSDWRL